MNDAWNSDDIDTAKAELGAAGWVAKTSTLWKSPTGSLHVGPAGAWRVMKRALNDRPLQTRPKSSWELRAEAAESHCTILRAALVGLVGVDGREELEQMETVMRLTPGIDEDKVSAINAIHALLSTLVEPTPAVDAVGPVVDSTRGGQRA